MSQGGGAAPLRPARTHQFKRDLERCRKRGFDLDLIRVIMGRLIHREALEPRLQNHALRGDWDGHRECHLRPDWLLIYRVADDQITFERTGTHADLFGEWSATPQRRGVLFGSNWTTFAPSTRSRMVEVADGVTVDPEQCGGRPCIRGMRIRVTDVLDMLASGASREEILRDFPDLESEDIDASLRYASRSLDYPIVAA